MLAKARTIIHQQQMRNPTRAAACHLRQAAQKKKKTYSDTEWNCAERNCFQFLEINPLADVWLMTVFPLKHNLFGWRSAEHLWHWRLIFISFHSPTVSVILLILAPGYINLFYVGLIVYGLFFKTIPEQINAHTCFIGHSKLHYFCIDLVEHIFFSLDLQWIIISVGSYLRNCGIQWLKYFDKAYWSKHG